MLHKNHPLLHKYSLTKPTWYNSSLSDSGYIVPNMRVQWSNDYGTRVDEDTHACATPERLRARVSLLARGSSRRVPDGARLLHVVLDVQDALPKGGRVVGLEAFYARREDPNLSVVQWYGRFGEVSILGMNDVDVLGKLRERNPNTSFQWR